MTSSLNTAAEAESAFYDALQISSITTMMQIWEDSEDIVCIHPLGPCLQGVDAVRQGWERIFASGVKMQFNISHQHCLQHDNLAIRVIHEHITIVGNDEQPTQPILATNIYRRGSDGWRLVLHHASPGATLMQNPSSKAKQHLH